jgi:hypothetical protein
LATRLADFNVQDTPLRDVLAQLQQASGMNMVVNWAALESIGVTPEQTVTLRLRNVSVERAMRAVVDLVGPDLIGYAVEQGVVEITLRDILDARLITRVYDVGDLLTPAADFSANAPSIDLAQTTQTGGGSSQGPFTGGQTAAREDTRRERMEQLVELVTSTVDPQVWDVNGGQARVRSFDRYLIVTAPAATHRKLLRR